MWAEIITSDLSSSAKEPVICTWEEGVQWYIVKKRKAGIKIKRVDIFQQLPDYSEFLMKFFSLWCLVFKSFPELLAMSAEALVQCQASTYVICDEKSDSVECSSSNFLLSVIVPPLPTLIQLSVTDTVRPQQLTVCLNNTLNNHEV